MKTSLLPPGPKQHPYFQLFKFLTDPVPLFQQCARSYGDIFTLRLGPNGNWVFLCSPELVKELYSAPTNKFKAGEAKARIFGPIVGRTSSLVLDGDAHLHRRRLLLGAFQGERMFAYTDTIRAVTEETIARWPQATPFSVHSHLQHIAFHSIIQGIFGRSVSPRLIQALERMVEDAVGSKLLFLKPLQRNLGSWSPWAKVLRAVEDADAIIFAEIAERRARGETSDQDLLSTLLSIRDESGAGLTDREIRDELVTMVVAGHEITGLTLSWCLVSFLENPSALERAHSEVDSVLGGGAFTASKLAQLTYLDAAIRESMRLHSAVPTGSARMLSEEHTIGGYTLPAGTMVTVGIDVLHRRADVYPEPLSFQPERFVGSRPNPYAWTPFGGGVRRCLGMAFALHEIKVVLATMLQKVRLKLEQENVSPRRRGAFSMPSDGPMISVTQRSSTATVNHGAPSLTRGAG